jgi:general nucleoside transport system permease protein
MSELFALGVLLSIFKSGVLLAMPYLYAAIGETFSQRSGVLNLGVEGIMLMGAFSGYFVALNTGNPWLGLLGAAFVGLLMGLMMAFVSVTLQATQGISGIGLHLFGLGLSSMLFKASLGSGAQSIRGFMPVRIPFLADIPFVGEVLFNHSLLVYGAFLLVPLAHWVLTKTTFGLMVRAVGQNPEAADSLGVNVAGIRYMTVSLGGILAGIAGASLSLALIKLFQENMTSGIGFIAVALVYFGGWRPWGVLGGAMLFSMVSALQLRIQIVPGNPIPSDILVMMPYVLTILALAFAVNRTHSPAALTKAFNRGEN